MGEKGMLYYCGRKLVGEVKMQSGKPEVSVLESEQTVRDFIEKIVAGICSSARHEGVSEDGIKQFFGKFEKKDSYSKYMPDISDVYAKAGEGNASTNIQNISQLLKSYNKNINVRSSEANPHKKALEDFISDVKSGQNKLEGIAQDGNSKDYDADDPAELSTFLKMFAQHVSSSVETSINPVKDTPQKRKKEDFKQESKLPAPVKMQDEGTKTESSTQLEFDKLKKEKAVVDEQVRELTKKISESESYRRIEKSEAEEAKRKDDEKISKLEKENAALRKKIDVPKEEEIGQLNKALEEQSEASKKKIEELNKEVARLQSSLEQEQKSHNELKKKEQGLRESKGKEIEELTSKLEQLTKSNTELNSANEKLKLANEGLEALKTPKPEDIAKSKAQEINLDKLKFIHNIFSKGTAVLAFGALAMYLPGLIEKGVARFGFERITLDMLHSTAGRVASNAAVPALLGMAFLAGEKRPYAFTMLTLFTSSVECYTSGGDKASILMLTGAAFLMFGEWSSRVNEAQERTVEL